MSTYQPPLHLYSLAGVTACLFLSLALHTYANESADEATDDNVDGIVEKFPFGGTEHTHDDEPSLVIAPRFHLRAALGDTGLEKSDLAHGGHDPAQSGFSIPALSLGADMHYGENIAGFTEGILSWNDEDHWNAELEELYLKFLHLPGGIDLKAGRLLAAIGTQNSIHNHAWKFVDADLGNVRFLGEDGLIIEGVELIWMVPTHWDDRLVVSLGDTIKHEHEEEGGEMESDHNHSEEAEEALWDKNILSARYQAIFWPRDTCQFIYGASYLKGENFMGENAQLYGLDFTYTWREDKPKGKQFTWRNDAMLRKVSTEEGSFEETTFSSAALYRFKPEWEMGLRYNYLEGVKDPELPERHRVSPSLSHYFLFGKIPSMARLQYNYDHSNERGHDHSIWLQFGFEWGSGSDSHIH